MAKFRSLILSLCLFGCQTQAVETDPPSAPPESLPSEWAHVAYTIAPSDVGHVGDTTCADRWGGDGRPYRICRLPFDGDGVLRFSIGDDPSNAGGFCQTGYTRLTLAVFDVPSRGGREIGTGIAKRPDGGCEFWASWYAPRGNGELCDFMGDCL